MKYISLSLLICLCACGGGSGGSSFSKKSAAATSPPSISDISITPINLRFTGGNVQVDCTVTDNRGVVSVDVDVAGPSGSQVFAMTASGDDYSATVPVSANENIYEENAIYTFVIKATDTDNNKFNSTSFTVTVQAMKRPPDPPAVIP